jgi:hypothetical protein
LDIPQECLMFVDHLRVVRSLRAVLSVGACMLLVACDRSSSTEPDVDGLVIREVILAGSDGSFSFSHRDHWHGAPVVRAAGTLGITLHFTDAQLAPDDHDAPPVEQWFSLADKPAEYNVRVVIEDTTVARWTGDRRGGTLAGLRDGASRFSVVVRRGTTTIYEAPPLNFRVQPAASSR